MIRVFFACTVAFSIPVSQLLSLDAFLKGSLMGIGPCILTKVLCAPFMGDAKFVIGWAMVGRAEFAYLIAQMAAAGNMIDEETFSICIWALLYATIFAPFIFRTVLNRYVKRQGLQEGAQEAKSAELDDAGFVENAEDPNANVIGKGIADVEDIKLDLEESNEPKAPQAGRGAPQATRGAKGFLCGGCFPMAGVSGN